MKENLVKISSLFTAFLASLCCIGPIVLAALGLGGVGFATSLEAYRPYFLTATVIFLAAGFYFTYRKREVVCADGSCEVRGAGRWSKISLWFVTVLVIFFVAFPYINWSGDQAVAGGLSPTELKSITVSIEGMTCESCNMAVETAIKKLDGVARIKADYESGSAQVQFDPQIVKPAQITLAIEDLGYKAKLPEQTD